MKNNNEQPFEELESVFIRLLTLREKTNLPALLENFSKKLEAIDAGFASPQAKPSILKTNLFVEIFQFEALSTQEIWRKAPKLHSLIGEIMDQRNPYEVKFRAKVKEKGLGVFLNFVE